MNNLSIKTCDYCKKIYDRNELEVKLTIAKQELFFCCLNCMKKAEMFDLYIKKTAQND